MSTSPADLPSPLEIPPLAIGLLHDLNPKTPREIILARQTTWAAAHLLNMIGDSPAEPDAKWLRLHNTADRIFHRNLRLLDRLIARRPEPSSTPAPTRRPEPAPEPARATAPTTPTRPTPTPPPHRRPNVFRRPRPDLDLPSPFPADSPLPVSATPA